MGMSHPIYALLERLEVIRQPQLDKARREAGSGDLDDVLDALARQPAWWRRNGEEAVPALTSYQLRQIRKHSKGETSPLEKALRLRHYLLVERLGAGGMGVVHKGWDLQKNRFVAIKRIRGNNPELRRRFRAERKALEQLNHPRIARLYDVIITGKNEILVMEYLDGGSLADRIEAGRPLDWREVTRWTIDLLEALEHARSAGILHRDIKPS